MSKEQQTTKVVFNIVKKDENIIASSEDFHNGIELGLEKPDAQSLQNAISFYSTGLLPAMFDTESPERILVTENEEEPNGIKQFTAYIPT